MNKNIVFLSSALLFSGIPLSQAEEINSFSQKRIASNSIESTNVELELDIKKPDITHDPSKCDEFEDPKSIHCLGPVQSTQPTNLVDRLIQGTATYASKLVPLLNKNAEGSAYSNMIINDGKSLMVDKGFGFANQAANSQIQKIPFFAQTSIAINASGEQDASFTLDSFMKLKEMKTDNEGDLKTIFFGQARGTTTTNSDNGSTTNLGLGLRHRPDDVSMIGGNLFWDYKMTDYSSAHSRLGLGGEYFWNDFELRNNYYMAITDKKTVTVDGTSYTERIVPGWDAEVGYRFPKNPNVAVFVKGFNWDYQDSDDQSGIATSLNWQATPHLNLEAYVSTEIFGHETKANSSLHGTDDYQVGLQVKWTGKPVEFNRNNIKENLVTQMTQPVRRRYDVLLERSSGGFSNRVGGS